MKTMLEKIKTTLNQKHGDSKFSVKKSLMSKMMCFVVGVVISIILLAWILNKVLFPSYYEEYKVEQVLSLYEELDKSAYISDSKLADDDKYTDKHLSNVFSEGTDANNCLNKIDKYGFEVYIFELRMDKLEALNINGDKKKTISEIDKHRRIHSIIANSHENEYHQEDYDIEIKAKSKENRYNILKYKAQEDSSAKLVLIGKLPSISGTDTTVILKADYTNISESVNISNRFL